MASFLNMLRFFGLLVFAIGVLSAIVTLLNFAFGWTDALWLRLYFIRVYLFLVVSGILLYIIITFRRKDNEKKE